jgi:acetolactate synthase-1/2/3 large subunit
MIRAVHNQPIAPEVEEDAPASRDSYIRELAPVKPVIRKQPAASPSVDATADASSHLVAALVEAGADTFFGVPGGPVATVFNAVMQAKGARLVQSRHETAAAFEAAGFYRATGRVPVVLVTAGPGITNAATGLASAYFERIPMLVICGDVAWATDGRRMLQNCGPEGLDVEHMFASVTRTAIRVTHPRSAATQALAALDAATDPMRRGPALLVVPIQHGTIQSPATRTERTFVERRAMPSPEVVAETCELLASAERPLIVLGAGCRPYAGPLRRLLDAFDIPFVTTPRAKGIVSELHPRSLRHGGLAASYWARRYTAEGVEVALVLGSDLDDCSIGATPYVTSGGKLVHVDLDSNVFHRNLPAHIGVVADVGDFIDAMNEYVADESLRHGSATAMIRELKGNVSPFEVPNFAADDAPTLRPHRAIADLQAAAGPEARFVTDIGEHMLFSLHYLTARDPDAFSIQLGLGSMGSGICSAIGLAMGDPSRRVVCVCGDGGMQMAGMEAIVAVRERLPVIFAVFNDARYNMVHHGFRSLFRREAEWDSPWIDFALWARSMGIPGMRINHPGELTAARLDLLATRQLPIVLDMRIDANVRLHGAGRVETLQHMSSASSHTQP